MSAFRPTAPRIKSDGDGSILVWQDHSVITPPRSIAHLFAERAGAIGERILVAKRDRHGSWISATYAEMLTRARRIAGGLLARGLRPGDRLLILSGESIDFVALNLGAMLAGVVAVPISVGNSTAPDKSRLTHIATLAAPSLIFAQDLDRFGPALDTCAALGFQCLRGIEELTVLERSAPPIAIDTLLAGIDGDTVHRLIMTSGTTQLPRAVIQNHAMSCASLAFEISLSTAPPGVLAPRAELTWLPWSHVGGCVTIFQLALYRGASIYFDDGKPAPGLFDETIRNIKELAICEYTSPPAAVTLLVDAMDEDEELAERFFANLQFVKTFAAGLPPETYRRLQAHAVAQTGQPIPFVSGYGTTETHGVISQTWGSSDPACLGLPKPGVLLKLVPLDAGYELRLRADSVTPGYFDDVAATESAFDEEGFFKTNDSVDFDPDNLAAGVRFKSRLAENFKMATGTWVNAAVLASAIMDHLDGAATACLVVGEGMESLGAMIWADADGVKRQSICDRLRTFNESRTGASQKIKRAIFSEMPISTSRFEQTEKGSLNRSKILAARSAELNFLYSNELEGSSRGYILF